MADGGEDLPALQDPAGGDAWALVMEWKKSNIPNELARRLTTRAEEGLSARRRREVLLAVLVGFCHCLRICGFIGLFGHFLKSGGMVYEEDLQAACARIQAAAPGDDGSIV